MSERYIDSRLYAAGDFLNRNTRLYHLHKIHERLNTLRMPRTLYVCHVDEQVISPFQVAAFVKTLPFIVASLFNLYPVALFYAFKTVVAEFSVNCAAIHRCSCFPLIYDCFRNIL